LGADWVELDVHLTRDGALAVIHDEALERTTNGHGLVKDHTLAELKRLDAGAWFGRDYAGQTIPTLDEVLEWASQRQTIVDIEIKNAPIFYAGIEEAVVKAVGRARMTEQVIVISFDHHAVRKVKALEPRIATGVLYSGRPVDAGVDLACKAEADALLPHVAYVTREDVQAAHAAGLSVAPWTTSDPQTLHRLIECGVDAIGTNHPDVLRQLLDAGESHSPEGSHRGISSAADEPRRADAPLPRAGDTTPLLEKKSSPARDLRCADSHTETRP
jgi:glycerophosphoryl diester phosphodiesterase